jgi:nicotinic acid mononucleotide adenylyltransferase
MALKFLSRTAAEGGSPVALLPGAWNPPTVAHIAIARAALSWASEVVLIIPRKLPHKEFAGVSFEERAFVLERLAAGEGLSAAVTESGLYFEIAAEAREALGDREIGLVCGRDAAERIATWNYGRPRVFEEMVQKHPLLVASRLGLWEGAGPGIIQIPIDSSFDPVSSSEVRRRLQAGEDWTPLVPETVRSEVARLYTGRG